MKLCLVRHAPLPPGIGLAGRRDLAAEFPDPAALEALRARIARFEPDQIWTSPALRCRQTATALGLTATARPELWEQSFGNWEGLAPSKIPDLGPLSTEELAHHRPEGGESFWDMVARVRPTLEEATGTTLIIAHAGTVRAALSMAFGASALSFSVAPLSLTVLDGAPACWSIEAVNWTA